MYLSETYHDILSQDAAQRLMQGDMDRKSGVGMLEHEGQGVVDCAREG